MNRVRKIFGSKRPTKWLFYGDSITHGAFHTMGWRDYTELFSERVRFELYRPDDVVIKTAFDGCTSRQLLANFDWRVAQFRPQVVFIMIGMNDCVEEKNPAHVPLPQFQVNVRELVQKVLGLNALPVLQTTCPILAREASARAPFLPAYMQAVRAVAKESQLPLIDHALYWHRLSKKQAGRFHYWLSDSLHPNEMGHRVFAELIFQKLGISDAKSSTCRFYYP